MITDTLAHLARYRGLHKNLDTAIDWLAAHDVTALPNGRTVIDGDAVFVNVMDAELRDAEDAAFEYHRRYADLQIDLTGAERWDWAAQGSPLVANAPYDAASDAGFAVSWERAGSSSSSLKNPINPAASAGSAPACARLWSKLKWAERTL